VHLDTAIKPLKLSLRNHQAPGDLLMLSAALRDLHACYPGQFLTEVKSSCQEIWNNNPYITQFGQHEKGVKRIKCEYPLIHKSNELPYHFIHGFVHFLNEKLNLNIRPTAFKGDIHLSAEEKSDAILKQFELDKPFWLLNAGGKNDFTIKWWDAQRYQQVVDHCKGRIQFVQVGSLEHHHPELEGVIDLRGKTTIRELMQLTYHADGVVTPVSFLMHLAAAIEPKHVDKALKPCVVIAGGREPVHWEEYPGHQFIHTVGALPCCAQGGCWKSRTVVLGDGSINDNQENLCVNVVNLTSSTPSSQEKKQLPRCMDMITAGDVIRRIGLYLDGGVLNHDKRSSQTAHKNVRSMFGSFKKKNDKRIAKTEPVTQTNTVADSPPAYITEQNSQNEVEQFLNTVSSYPKKKYRGKGIVICGGGEKYFPGTWVLVNILRYHGCDLPIELWHLGKEELSEHMAQLIQPLGVTCIDGFEVRKKHPCRILKGWELKAFALLYSSFEEVLLLDADNVPTNDPTELFNWPEYERTGAVFWPDVNKLSKGRRIWELVGTPYREESEFESGQILVNKRRCWKALNLSLFLNEHSDFYYKYIHGDKETFHMGFRKTQTDYEMTQHHVVLRDGTMYQHDFKGSVLFQHRNGFKWNLHSNPTLSGFLFEAECIGFVQVLGNIWNGTVDTFVPTNEHAVQDDSSGLTTTLWYYERMGFDRRPIVFRPDGKIGLGAGTCEQEWHVGQNGSSGKLILTGEDGIICELESDATKSTWTGKWLKHEKMPIKLSSINKHKE